MQWGMDLLGEEGWLVCIGYGCVVWLTMNSGGEAVVIAGVFDGAVILWVMSYNREAAKSVFPSVWHDFCRRSGKRTAIA
jgi:hypothetical protein